MASAKLLTRLKSEKFTILATTVRFRPPFLPATAWFSGKGRDEKERVQGLKVGVAVAAAGTILGLSGLAYSLR